MAEAGSMEENQEKENVPPSKKRRVSLSLNKKRFQPSSSEEIDEMAKRKVPKNTEKTSKWAMKNLEDWFKDYNERNPDKKCPDEFLTGHGCSKEVICKWLCLFVNETRNKSGERYPPKTIQCLLAGIMRHMRDQNSEYPNFMSKDDPAFHTFIVTLDNLFKNLRSDGIGTESSLTESISKEEEDQLWKSGVLNVTSPLGLLRAVFYYNGKCFCLRGGEEHRQLKISQFQRLQNPNRYVYSENSSKNRPGGLLQTYLSHKVVPIVENPAVGERCHVSILDKYIIFLLVLNRIHE
uniref:Uncharacterized protein n=1 Tax=Amphimedon queenslandica TaxID=400682 RepID=A0A1X7T9L7_AMPQE